MTAETPLEVLLRELKSTEAQLREAEERNTILDSRLTKAERALKEEKFVSKSLTDAGKRDKRDVDDVLYKLERIELESRAKLELEKRKTKTVLNELEELNTEYTEEKALRLHSMYLVGMEEKKTDQATREASGFKTIIEAQEEERAAVNAEVRALKAALSASERIGGGLSHDVAVTANQNRGHVEDTHLLRQRLVDAERDAVEWRRKFQQAAKQIKALEAALDKALDKNNRTGRGGQRTRDQPTGPGSLGRHDRHHGHGARSGSSGGLPSLQRQGGGRGTERTRQRHTAPATQTAPPASALMAAFNQHPCTIARSRSSQPKLWPPPADSYF
jgi:chromosome segregation ATPase